MSDEHKYEVVMTSGDRAECDTLAAVYTAVLTLSKEGDGAMVEKVTAFGRFHQAATATARIHLLEHLTRDHRKDADE